MAVEEIRCPKCGNLLTKADVKDGVIDGFCRKCKTHTTFRFQRIIRIENGRILVLQKMVIFKGGVQNPEDVIE